MEITYTLIASFDKEDKKALGKKVIELNEDKAESIYFITNRKQLRDELHNSTNNFDTIYYVDYYDLDNFSNVDLYIVEVK